MIALQMIGGLLLLVAGAEALVRGASRLALGLGISPLVVGLTVVAFGTSAPELAVSVQSAWAGEAELALGNVVGSNIFNVLVILGLSALLIPLAVTQQLVRFDVPLMIGISLLLWWLAADGSLSRAEGALLFAGILAYTGWGVITSRRESATVREEYQREFGNAPGRHARMLVDLALVGLGLGLLVGGSSALVAGATALARLLEWSELVIGLTIVAAGTSLPELTTSIVASVRGERDIAVGNVVGSNIFNILAVLGAAALVAPAGMAVAPAALRFDLPVMIAVALVCLPVFWTGGRIARAEGAVFLLFYLSYLLYMILHLTGHPARHVFDAGMLWLVLPLTALGIGASIWQAMMARSRKG